MNLSELLNRPKAALAELRGARSVLLHRRGEDDLMLTTAARARQDSEVMDATTRMFMELMRRPEGRQLVLDVLPAAFPWVRHLPPENVREFAVELVESLGAGAEFENTAGVAQLLTEWRHTAEVHADPELRAALSRDTGEDFGSVPDPQAAP